MAFPNATCGARKNARFGIFVPARLLQRIGKRIAKSFIVYRIDPCDQSAIAARESYPLSLGQIAFSRVPMVKTSRTVGIADNSIKIRHQLVQTVFQFENFARFRHNVRLRTQMVIAGIGIFRQVIGDIPQPKGKSFRCTSRCRVLSEKVKARHQPRDRVANYGERLGKKAGPTSVGRCVGVMSSSSFCHSHPQVELYQEKPTDQSAGPNTLRPKYRRILAHGQNKHLRDRIESRASWAFRTAYIPMESCINRRVGQSHQSL